MSLHISEKPHLRKIFAQQTSVIVAIDGLRPDVGARASCGSFARACLEKFCWRVHGSSESEAAPSSVNYGSESGFACPNPGRD